MIYTIGIYHQGSQMAETGTAKIFKHGRSQAVRLPKEFRLPGKEVRIRRVGTRRAAGADKPRLGNDRRLCSRKSIDQAAPISCRRVGRNSRQCRSTIVSTLTTNDLPRYQHHHSGDQPARGRGASAPDGQHFTKAPSSAFQRSYCTSCGTASKRARERSKIPMRSMTSWRSMSRHGRLKRKTPKRPAMFVLRL